MATDVLVSDVTSSDVEKLPPDLVLPEVPKKASAYSVKFWYLDDNKPEDATSGMQEDLYIESISIHRVYLWFEWRCE